LKGHRLNLAAYRYAQSLPGPAQPLRACLSPLNREKHYLAGKTHVHSIGTVVAFVSPGLLNKGVHEHRMKEDRPMNTTILNSPGFQTLPKGVKQMLVVSEAYFFDQPKSHCQEQNGTAQDKLRQLRWATGRLEKTARPLFPELMRPELMILATP
jgi:hypothetical protein